MEAELKQAVKELLERIKAALYDEEEREIRDLSVKLWLKELRAVAYDAEDVLDEYRLDVLRAQVEARDHASPPPSPKVITSIAACEPEHPTFFQFLLDKLTVSENPLYLRVL